MSTASNDAFGRDVLQRTWPQTLGDVPDQRELQLVQAVSRGEGGYGLASYALLDIEPGPNYGAVIGSSTQTNNWGATQAGSPPCDPATSFMATDTSPNRKTAENPKGYYNACFRRNPTPEAGCASFLKILLVGSSSHPRQGVREAVRTGSADEVARAMHASGYYEGFGATVEDRITNYANAIAKNAERIAVNLGEPLLVTRGEGGFFSPGPAGGRIVGLAMLLGAGYLVWRGVRG